MKECIETLYTDQSSFSCKCLHYFVHISRFVYQLVDMVDRRGEEHGRGLDAACGLSGCPSSLVFALWIPLLPCCGCSGEKVSELGHSCATRSGTMAHFSVSEDSLKAGVENEHAC